MNFYFDAAKVLDRLDARQGSIKGIIASLPEKDRSRTAALVIETLKCEVAPSFLTWQFQYNFAVKTVLVDTIEKSKLMKQERKLSSLNLALVLVHDLLLARGIQAGDGPIKQAILRHKARLNGEFQKIKIHRGVSSNAALANDGDERAGTFNSSHPVYSHQSSAPSADSSLCPREHLANDTWRRYPYPGCPGLS